MESTQALVLHWCEERGSSSSFPVGNVLLGFQEDVLTEILRLHGVALSGHEERGHVEMCPLGFLVYMTETFFSIFQTTKGCNVFWQSSIIQDALVGDISAFFFKKVPPLQDKTVN